MLGPGAELALCWRRGGEGAELCQGEGFRPKAGLGTGRRFPIYLEGQRRD